MPEPIHVPTAEEVHASCNVRIAELEAALRYIYGVAALVPPTADEVARYRHRICELVDAALPDTEGPQITVELATYAHRHLLSKPCPGEPDCRGNIGKALYARPDTEGEQHG